MVRGAMLFKCRACGKRFMAPDIEMGATILSVPQPCPKCKSMRTRPWSLFGLNHWTYKKRWEMMEENKK